MNNKIVLKWSNSSYNNNPTQTSVQRSNRLGFNHPQSIIEEITRGQDHGLNPLSKDGYYKGTEIVAPKVKKEKQEDSQT